MREARALIRKYKSGNCTPEEIAQLHRWFQDQGMDVPAQLTAQDLDEAKSAFSKAFQKEKSEKRIGRFGHWVKIGAAAAILMITGFAFYFFKTYESGIPAQQTAVKADILPGDNKAILVLENGEEIDLFAQENGSIIQELGVSISKNEAGFLVYEPVATLTDLSGTVRHNVIRTPRGGQYKVQLPDSTLVWLNAASTLRYPISFSGDERIVELEGEAFFEVNRNFLPNAKAMPFVVKTKAHQIEVLGTDFNISAYAGERAITTLIEGSLQISSPLNHNRKHILVPGQQGYFEGNTPIIMNIDTESVYAWKNGYFLFDDEPLERIMKTIERWYDVDVEYHKNVDKNEKFWGSVSRFENVSKLLEKLELTETIRFEIKGRRVIVMR